MGHPVLDGTGTGKDECGEILRNCPDEDTLAVLTRVISALAKVDWSGVGLVQKRVDEIKRGE